MIPLLADKPASGHCIILGITTVLQNYSATKLQPTAAHGFFVAWSRRRVMTSLGHIIVEACFRRFSKKRCEL